MQFIYVPSSIPNINKLQIFTGILRSSVDIKIIRSYQSQTVCDWYETLCRQTVGHMVPRIEWFGVADCCDCSDNDCRELVGTKIINKKISTYIVTYQNINAMCMKLTLTNKSDHFLMLRSDHIVLYSLVYCLFAIGMENRFRHTESENTNNLTQHSVVH